MVYFLVFCVEFTYDRIFFLDQYKKKQYSFVRNKFSFYTQSALAQNSRKPKASIRRTDSGGADRTHDVPAPAALSDNTELTLPDYNLLIACKELGSVKRQFIEVKHKITS